MQDRLDLAQNQYDDVIGQLGDPSIRSKQAEKRMKKKNYQSALEELLIWKSTNK